MLIVLHLFFLELIVALFIFMLSLRYNACPLQLSQLCAGIFLQIVHYQLLCLLSCQRLRVTIKTFTRGCLAVGVQKLDELVCLHAMSVWKHDRDRILGVTGEGLWLIWMLCGLRLIMLVCYLLKSDEVN